VESVKKTSRLLVVDEDVPGGASAYILQQILEVQGGYRWLDSAPSTSPQKRTARRTAPMVITSASRAWRMWWRRWWGW
jgi:pyruvate/2-oxoglutarate/acetoin dehydrogenase E1 component